jgi:hypothetical protein
MNSGDEESADTVLSYAKNSSHSLPQAELDSEPPDRSGLRMIPASVALPPQQC